MSRNVIHLLKKSVKIAIVLIECCHFHIVSDISAYKSFQRANWNTGKQSIGKHCLVLFFNIGLTEP